MTHAARLLRLRIRSHAFRALASFWARVNDLDLDADVAAGARLPAPSKLALSGPLVEVVPDRDWALHSDADSHGATLTGCDGVAQAQPAPQTWASYTL